MVNSNRIDKLSVLFWLTNVLFWFAIAAFRSLHNYYQKLHFDKPMAFYDVWLDNSVWLGLWAIFTPIVFMAPKWISFERLSVFRFVVNHLAFMSCVLLIYWGCGILIEHLVQFGDVNLVVTLERYSNIPFSNFQTDILVYVAILFTRYCVIYYQSSKLQSIRNKELANQLVQVELQALKSQLNPHFLFNTLNTVTSLIRLERSESAITALSELGLMLRRVLENQHNQMTSVEQEMEFIYSFLTIQKMRFGDKINCQINIDPSCQKLPIPFMLLQPLIENAVQHGSQLQTSENLIKLEITQANARLTVKLTNQMSETSDHKGFGIGVNNCQQRLKMLYGDNFELHLKELSNRCFETDLTIPIGA